MTRTEGEGEVTGGNAGPPDDSPIDQIQLPKRLRNALKVAGFRTVGELRETTDQTLFSLPGVGRISLSYLRKTLGRAPAR
jgi:DNA-directed RNA polymerase alpha subunit